MEGMRQRNLTQGRAPAKSAGSFRPLLPLRASLSRRKLPISSFIFQRNPLGEARWIKWSCAATPLSSVAISKTNSSCVSRLQHQQRSNRHSTLHANHCSPTSQAKRSSRFPVLPGKPRASRQGIQALSSNVINSNLHKTEHKAKT
jgi:hypothetical protein